MCPGLQSTDSSQRRPVSLPPPGRSRTQWFLAWRTARVGEPTCLFLPLTRKPVLHPGTRATPAIWAGVGARPCLRVLPRSCTSTPSDVREAVLTSPPRVPGSAPLPSSSLRQARGCPPSSAHQAHPRQLPPEPSSYSDAHAVPHGAPGVLSEASPSEWGWPAAVYNADIAQDAPSQPPTSSPLVRTVIVGFLRAGSSSSSPSAVLPHEAACSVPPTLKRQLAQTEP